MKKSKFFYTILLSALLIFVACADDSDDDADTQPDGEVSCDNGILDGAETGIDCDTDTATVCPPCAFCGDGLLSSVLLPDDVSGMYEYDVDCGTPECGGCPQELTIAAIGENGAASAFRDQYSYNRILSAAGQDTISLPAEYPGLRVEKNVSGFQPNHLVITANQGINTSSSGLYVRTVRMYIPFPENSVPTSPFVDMPAVSIPMVSPLPGIIPGSCQPPIINMEVPFIIYTEKNIDNPQLLHRCFFSYIPEGMDSALSINHLLGYLDGGSQYYVKGGINTGGLVQLNLLGDDFIGAFSGVEFKIHYPYFP